MSMSYIPLTINPQIPQQRKTREKRNAYAPAPTSNTTPLTNSFPINNFSFTGLALASVPGPHSTQTASINTRESVLGERRILGFASTVRTVGKNAVRIAAQMSKEKLYNVRNMCMVVAVVDVDADVDVVVKRGVSDAFLLWLSSMRGCPYIVHRDSRKQSSVGCLRFWICQDICQRRVRVPQYEVLYVQ